MDDDVKEALLEELRRLHDELGVPPRTVDIGRWSRFEPGLYAETFGSWDEALDAAGIEGEPQRPPDDVTVEEPDGEADAAKDDETGNDSETSESRQRSENDDIDDVLKPVVRCDKRVKGAPSPNDLRERGYGVNAILDEYGTWKAALEDAGIDAEYVEEVVEERDDGPLAEIRRYTRLHGREPTASDVEEANWMSDVDVYRDRFGSVEGAVEEVGEETEASVPSRNELLKELKRYYLRHGSAPTPDDVKDEPNLSDPSAYIRRFGGVEEAVEESGLEE